MKRMDETTRVLAALQQVDNIVSLLDDNISKDYLYNHLIQIRCELDRQLQFLPPYKP
jgi:hypothetical protein